MNSSPPQRLTRFEPTGSVFAAFRNPWLNEARYMLILGHHRHPNHLLLSRPIRCARFLHAPRHPIPNSPIQNPLGSGTTLAMINVSPSAPYSTKRSGGATNTPPTLGLRFSHISLVSSSHRLHRASLAGRSSLSKSFANREHDRCFDSDGRQFEPKRSRSHVSNTLEVRRVARR